MPISSGIFVFLLVVNNQSKTQLMEKTKRVGRWYTEKFRKFIGHPMRETHSASSAFTPVTSILDSFFFFLSLFILRIATSYLRRNGGFTRLYRISEFVYYMKEPTFSIIFIFTFLFWNVKRHLRNLVTTFVMKRIAFKRFKLLDASLVANRGRKPSHREHWNSKGK